MNDGISRNTLPHNLETERALLGGLILSGDLLGEVSQTIAAEDFAKPAHQVLYRTLCSMRNQSAPLDLTTVADEVEKCGRMEQIGGVMYLMNLPGACPSVASVPSYAARVKDHSTRRRLQLVAHEIIEQIQDGGTDTATMLDNAESAIFRLAQGARVIQDWESAETLAPAFAASVRERAKVGDDITGITTGFTDLDKLLCGWQPSDLVIVAARPAMGKTALALNFATAAAATGIAVGIFSLEMGSEQLVGRMICAAGPVDAQHVRTGRLNPEEWPRLDEGEDRVAALPIRIDKTASLTISALRSKARRLKAMCPTLGLLVVDYLQLMQGDNARENREAVISGISRGLKVLAKDLNIPILALSQLNRGVESRGGHRPQLSDLRESGAIEQDADVVMFIYRDEVYNEGSTDRGVAEVIVAKHRAGETGTVRLGFAGRHMRFSSLTSRTESR